MSISLLPAHIDSLIKEDEELTAFLGDGYLTLGTATQFPCVIIDAISCPDDKLGTYEFNLHIYAKSVENDAAADLAFYDIVDRLKVALRASHAIVPDGWLPRPDTRKALLGALFPCTVYLANLDQG